LIAAGTTATGVQQSLQTGTAGQLLQSGGAAALPTWTTATFPSGSGTLNHMLRSDGTNWVETTATTLDALDVFSGISELNVSNLRLNGNTISSTDTNGNIALIPNGTGSVLIGSPTAIQSSTSTIFRQTIAKNGTQAIFNLGAFINNSQGPRFAFVKSRSTTIGAFTAVQSGDVLGGLQWAADDGTGYVNGGGLLFLVSGAISTGVIPSALVISTTNTSGVDTTAITISNNQTVTFRNNAILGQSGRSGALTSYPSNASAGLLQLAAANNAGDFSNLLTNVSTTGSRTWSLPDATGTIQLVGGSLGAATATSLTFSPTTGGIIGTTTNDNVSAGTVGELDSTVVLLGSAVSLLTLTPIDVVTLVLQPGDYDVWGEVWFDVNGATIISSIQVGINTTTATIATTPSENTSNTSFPVTLAAGVAPTMTLGQCRISVATATTTTVYLVVNATFTVSTLSGYGKILARRRR